MPRLRTGRRTTSTMAARCESAEVTLPDDAMALAAFDYELGLLKRIRRSGWWHVGVRDPESVAEHTVRVAQLAALIAAEGGADPARASFLALWHDTQETRTGDLRTPPRSTCPSPSHGRSSLTQTGSVPERSREMVREAVDEYESRLTPEARCAKDADKLEMLLQAVEYREIGVQRVDGWIESARKGLSTETARASPRAPSTCRRSPGGNDECVWTVGARRLLVCRCRVRSAWRPTGLFRSCHVLLRAEAYRSSPSVGGGLWDQNPHEWSVGAVAFEPGEQFSGRVVGGRGYAAGAGERCDAGYSRRRSRPAR